MLKFVREKDQVIYKQRHIRIILDSQQRLYKLEGSRQYNLQPLRAQRCQSRSLYPAILSITMDGENRIFQEKPNLNNIYQQIQQYRKILEGKLQHKEVNSKKTQELNNSTPVKIINIYSLYIQITALLLSYQYHPYNSLLSLSLSLSSEKGDIPWISACLGISSCSRTGSIFY